MTMETGLSSLVRRNKLGIMGDGGDDDKDVSVSSDVSSLTSSDDESDDASPSSDEDPKGGLDNMSDLLQELPFKRGLSKHFQGKSQSFTSLANAVCLQDLEKPQNPYNTNKKLKSCKSYMALSNAFSPSPPTRSASSSKLFKTPSSSLGASCSSLSNKPPIHPTHHANTKTPQTPLFV